MAKSFLGGRLRQLRDSRGLTQAALAARLGLSPSYLNQLERNQRPLTVAVLLKINAEFGGDIQFFSEEGDARLLAELREAFQGAGDVAAADLRNLIENMPALARHIVALFRDTREAQDRATAMAVGAGHPEGLPAPTAFEEVRDFFYDHRNHFDALDRRAEALFDSAGLQPGNVAEGLARHLARQGIRVQAGDDPARLRQFDAQRGLLELWRGLRPDQRGFQMATQIALNEAGSDIESALAQGRFAADSARALGRIGLANYFAGALMMPYAAFWSAAEETGYDIDALGARFGTGFEATCHRLSSLQRDGMRGVPFFFLRVDRAGNISKRQSATDFHFSKIGGSCPLWRVHAAFDHPGEILTQIAEMPDERRYFWVTRTVATRPARWGATGKVFAVALGCDIDHAGRLVYARGVNLSDRGTPIGSACKACPRRGCAQRAFPMLGQPLAVDPQSAVFAPYSARPEAATDPLAASRRGAGATPG
ncbi:short-chain fatty acyl-CoA regulator family protein [Paracoccus jiaweipingae]|uniref:short-chain fatty acyl-CoA regulator family protein n=1 Tax=unclassified Paracoccus (in: a-proteobacteria) TaxID=2688777 RepID=UPI0037916E71